MKGNYKNLALICIMLMVVQALSPLSFAGGAIKTETEVTTARTINDFRTGILEYDEVDVGKYDESVLLSGTVTIDGPKLILKVNGEDVTSMANIVKVADKVWSYSYLFDLNGQVGDVGISIEAYTIYVNGKPAGDIHTNAGITTQTVHVPYVVSFEVSNLTWDSYDPESNTIYYSYTLLRIWDDGSIDEDIIRYTGEVDGTGTVEIFANDPTHNGGSDVLVLSTEPPVYLRVLDVVTDNQDFVWEYDESTETYSVSFEVVKIYSNGTSEIVTVTYSGLVPGEDNAIEVEFDGVTIELVISAPDSPVSELTVESVNIVITNIGRLAQNQENNNFKVSYDIEVTLSDGSVYYVDGFDVTIPYNSGNNFGSKDVSKTLSFDGVDYELDFTVTIQDLIE